MRGKKNIDKIVQSLKKEKGVEAIYLFGSQATGRAKPYSDIDLCVMTSRNAKKEQILSHASDRVDTSLFWDLPLDIRYRVIKEGRSLFIRNPLAHQRIVVRTVLSYLDMAPFLDRHFSRVLS